MKKNTIILSLLAVMALLPAALTHAYVTPTMTATALSNNTIQVNITADPNSVVQLYYNGIYGNTSATYVGSLGTTGQNGYYTVNIPAGQYNIPTGSFAYIMVNGYSSTPVAWPNTTYNNGGYYPITFSTNNLNVVAGQSISITVSGGSSSGYSISNTSPNLTASINNSVITVYGTTPGAGTVTVCSSSATSCGTLYINIISNGGGYIPPVYTPPVTYYPPTTYYPPYNQYPQYPVIQPLSLSQNSLFLNVGQSQSVYINGQGNYYLTNNTNSYIATVSIVGGAVYVRGNTAGTTNVTVCQSGGSCANLYITITGGFINYPTYPLPFNQNGTYPVYQTYPYNYGNQYNNYPWGYNGYNNYY